MRGFLDKNWSPMLFEEVADVIDKEDNVTDCQSSRFHFNVT